ncbi:hypothetical protein AJ85_13800 [Alkalihalobacillus alcalophilus ATCC 27647 = CGMCC 1.3604]|uniref:Thiol-disulfide oxidoreductase n=1 Tax=Alkalihalobacillus alcalophilus ATCC 27647 = CGMCC 1.3604 TaxID=1218173 RepID=A0A094XFB1_ALKAL|nr:DCC1-like thiol-disulfide oxidoreductase family protein [Alkalihalobacillus alcalophilus]KGA97470.1 hypothetical protein BALCAV_0209880 [Alkalihalobacillus alcalophilus ATCC 27647 = CGMCC 1.3604]MED1563288.1 DCC1-like thiol-disulfide oxidoreductase family protein [Alkalihalobacillus alcalophilus]THG92245.1 hypothetical protein AJ85_13800 [Alkalihalobacillus alcalophilus ATCC 27647 = CGMCC 1.3604]
MEIDQEAIILFDGVCNVCNKTIDFLLKHDKQQHFKFASIQSKIGQQLIQEYRIDPTVDSVIVIEQNKAHLHSDAVLKIIPKLSWYWQWLRLFKVVPRRWRDRFYFWFAKNRYRFFGTKSTCRLPTKEERKRFLE